MFIPYIIVIDKSGWATEEKFKKEVESLPKVGELIKTFYDELFIFHNVSGLKNEKNERLIVINDKLQVVSSDMIVEKIKDSINKLINQAYNSESISFTSDARSDSLLKCAANGFKKYYDLDIKLFKEDFSAKKYQTIQNELIVYSNASDDSLFINKFLSALNTVMAIDEKIEFKGGARFLTYTDEKEHLDYSAASEKFADMQDSGYNHQKLRKKI